MRTSIRFLIILIFLFIVSACTQQHNLTQTIVPVETTVKSDHVSLHVRIAGNLSSGNVLIAIHGGPGMTSDYMLNLEELVGVDLAVINYDQRGVGRSSNPPAKSENYTLDRYAEDLEAIRLAIDVDRVHLFGHSWGGIVAQHYASLYPDHVRSVILMGSGPPTREQTLACQEAILQRFIDLMQQGIIPENQNSPSAENILRAYFSDPSFWFAEDDLGSAPNIDERTELVSELTWKANAHFDLTSDLIELNLPVLNLWGEDDPAQPVANPAIQSAFQNADLETVVIKDCGHFWHECTEQVFSAMRNFLDNLIRNE